MVATAESKQDIHPTVMACVSSTLEGNVTIQAHSIVHPNATIRATAGPIVIGANNVIEENALIENTNENGEPLIIGDDNTFEIGSVVRAARVGSGNVFGVQSVVGPGVLITDACSIGVRCSVLRRGVELPPRTAIFGEHNTRRIAATDPATQVSILDVQRKLLANYHRFHGRAAPAAK